MKKLVILLVEPEAKLYAFGFPSSAGIKLKV